jgi:hypothetical protein
MRQINLYVKTCSECPYCRYDSNYGRSYDSGYDCTNYNGGRIMDDWKISQNKLSGKIPIPKSCPLKEADDVLINRITKLKKIKENLK